MWNEGPPDPQWAAGGGLGTNPFATTTLFNSFFTPHSALNGKSMYSLVTTGGTEEVHQKAARDVVAAYLNASFFGPGSFPYSPSAIASAWTAAVQDGSDAAFLALHRQLDKANNQGKCGS
jgi:hypothetical protein